ncbi:MAG TPA: anti-sigma factor [Thermomicrobiaceae bacterium]|nr:anti-sigma factor [Thermomicrobiaceae bacterium]
MAPENGYDHDEVQSLLGAYALDALPETERARVAEHLPGCAACRAELAELTGAVDALALTVAERDPSPELRERLRLAAVASLDGAAPGTPLAGAAPVPDAPPRPTAQPNIRLVANRFAPWAIAAVFLLFALGMLGWNVSLRQQVSAASVALQTTSAAPAARGELTYLKGRQVLILDVRDLPALAPGEVYQVWLIQGSTPIPSGVFAASSARLALAADPANYQAVAITVEPGPLGNSTPQGDKVVVTPLTALGG